jgi:hypothetical protein
MGAFKLKHEPEKKHFAHLTYNNRNYLIPLPLVSEEGCVMSVTLSGHGGKDLYMTIKQSLSQANKKICY